MKRIFILTLLAPLFVSLYAQDISQPTNSSERLSLSLKEAQEYAIRENRSLQNASLEVQKAHAQRWQTIASMLPQLQGNAGYTDMLGYEINFGVMSRKMLPYVNAGVQASIALNGQMIVGALLNDVAIDMQNINLEQQEITLRNSVYSTYMSILILEDITRLLQGSLTNIETLADMTQQTVNAGAAEQTTADQIKVRVNTLKNNINSNSRNIELSRNSLRVLLGVPAETEIQLTQSLEDLLSAEQMLQLLGTNFDLHDNLNYQMLEKNVEIAKKNVTMASVAYVPTLSAYYQYNYRKDIGEGGFSMSPPNTVGVSLSMPLFTSGKNGAAIKEKLILLDEARNTLAETTDQLGIQYKQLRFNLNNAYETYMNEKDNIEVTQRVFDNTTNKFKWGTASNLELTNASNDLISAQSSYVQATLQLVQAQVELNKFLNK